MTRLVQSLRFALSWLAGVLWAFTGAALAHRIRMARLNYHHRQYTRHPAPLLLDADLPPAPTSEFDAFMTKVSKEDVRR